MKNANLMNSQNSRQDKATVLLLPISSVKSLLMPLNRYLFLVPDGTFALTGSLVEEVDSMELKSPLLDVTGPGWLRIPPHGSNKHQITDSSA